MPNVKNEQQREQQPPKGESVEVMRHYEDIDAYVDGRRFRVERISTPGSADDIRLFEYRGAGVLWKERTDEDGYETVPDMIFGHLDNMN